MLSRAFFQRSPQICARELVGCELIKGSCRAIIVETEAYAEFDDPACHTATRVASREFIEKNPAGTAYVYLNYGMYWLLNVLTKTESPAGNGFVLLRAVMPISGIPQMRLRRAKGRSSAVPSHDRWLCSGPGKLAQAFDVDGLHHGVDLCDSTTFGFRSGTPQTVLATTRVGISKAIDFPWRFVAADSPYVSVKA